MLFSSPVFLSFFLPAVVLSYYLLPGKNWTLLLFSLFFYAWGEPALVTLLLFVIVFNYCIGRLIGPLDRGRRRWALLCTGVGVNLLILGTFKYLGFLVESLNNFIGASFPIPNITLPLGVSFFAFQAISYLVDVHRGDVRCETSLLKLGVFKSFFPQLIAGPIVRYGEVSSDLAHRTTSFEMFATGLERFIVGLAKKVLIADTLAPIADSIFAKQAGDLSSPMAWLGLIAFALQIYFDFSGYSDMAIGLARMFGFHFPENFNFPYSAQSVQDFWRRWHMTLSRWFRDYLYIPLGGNRRGPFRTYVNLWLTFAATGLWHGANWTFLAWGLWHGAFLVLERSRFGEAIRAMPQPARHLYALLAVLLGWVWFRAGSIEGAAGFYKALFIGGIGDPMRDLPAEISPYAATMLVIGMLWAMPIGRFSASLLGESLAAATSLQAAARGALVLFVSLICFAATSAGTLNSFIYFRF